MGPDSSAIAHAEYDNIPATGNASPLSIILTPRQEGPILALVHMSPTSRGRKAVGAVRDVPSPQTTF